VRHRQETRGRPGVNTRYRQITRTKYRIHFVVREDVIWTDARSDGCWPLITNEKTATGTAVLTSYKHQPSLERRHSQLKGDQFVARCSSVTRRALRAHGVPLHRPARSCPRRTRDQTSHGRSRPREDPLYPNTDPASRRARCGSSRSSAGSPASTSPTRAVLSCRPSHRAHQAPGRPPRSVGDTRNPLPVSDGDVKRSSDVRKGSNRGRAPTHFIGEWPGCLSTGILHADAP